MTESVPAFHHVCTHERAAELVENHDRFWISNCGCRESRGKCNRSRVDLCLIFTESFPGSGTGKRQVAIAGVQEILREAKDKHLVARPFRDDKGSGTGGICFCCDDCCSYFLNPIEKCDRGELVEATDLLQCSDCGECAGVCYFGARRMNEGKLAVDTRNCYGCGLCMEVCPEECIRLINRE